MRGIELTQLAVLIVFVANSVLLTGLIVLKMIHKGESRDIRGAAPIMSD